MSIVSALAGYPTYETVANSLQGDGQSERKGQRKKDRQNARLDEQKEGRERKGGSEVH